jgi:hypothetical protein
MYSVSSRILSVVLENYKNMPDPITTLGLAKTATELVKEATALARATKNTDLAEKLIDVYQNVVELTDTNQQLRTEVQALKSEVAELKRRPEVASRLRYDNHAYGSYYLKSVDGRNEDGPFCTVCWDVDGRLVRQYRTGPQSFMCDYCAHYRRK